MSKDKKIGEIVHGLFCRYGHKFTRDQEISIEKMAHDVAGLFDGRIKDLEKSRGAAEAHVEELEGYCDTYKARVEKLEVERDAAHKRIDQLETGLREAIELIRDCIPEFHAQGMGCGIEDRSIHDRYAAAQHGWEKAIERVEEHFGDAADEFEAVLFVPVIEAKAEAEKP